MKYPNIVQTVDAVAQKVCRGFELYAARFSTWDATRILE